MDLGELHTFFTHFPIAFFVLVFILEIIRLFSSRIDPIVSVIILFLGTSTSFLSVQTGQIKIDNYINIIEQESADIHNDKINSLKNHKKYGNIIMWTSIFIFFIWLYLILNGIDNRFLKLFLSLILTVLVLRTASLGGALVQDSYEPQLIPNVGTR